MADRVLIIQQSSEADSLEDVLAKHFDVYTSEHSEESLTCCDEFRPDVALLDVDSSDPEMLQLCRELKQSGRDRPPQLVVVARQISADERLKIYEAGADDCLTLPLDIGELRARIEIQTRLRQALDQSLALNSRMESYASELERLVDSKAAALEATQDITVLALAKLADSRDPETGEHLERMRTYSQILARCLRYHGPYTHQIDDMFLEDLYRASPLHDIGKVGIPDSILLKPGRLTPDEFDRMKLHTVLGAETLEEAARHAGGCRFLKMAAQIARYHHERFDGSGYPSGLKGLEIPLAARIVALADVYDALTSRRVYKPAIDADSAKEHIIEQAGRHFDPAIVEVFESCYDEFLKVPMVVRGNMCSDSQVVITDDSPQQDLMIGLDEAFPAPVGGRILLAGDEEGLLETLANWLQQAGYRIERAPTGDEALRRLVSDCPQFMIAASSLPDMSGSELCRKMRSKRLPVYVYTLVLLPQSQLAELNAAAEAGADDFLFQATTESELVARLRSAERVLKLLRELSQRPRCDPLTGTPTRRLIDDQLCREWRRSTRYGIPISCAFIDIDNFSEVNEKLGAGHGDAALRFLAGMLGDNCRPTDYLFRRGPDSFCVVLTETNEHGAASCMERLRVLVAAQDYATAEAGVPITISCGVAQRKSTHDQIDHLIEAAEQAQSVARQLGGDRIMRFGSLGDTEDLQKAFHLQDGRPFHGLVARDIMSEPIVSLDQEDTVEDAASFLMRHRINSAPVVDNDGKLAGIVSEKDLMSMMVSAHAWKRPIHEVMTPNVVSYDELHSVYAIYKFLMGSPIRRVVIVKGQRPTGVVSRGTLLRSFGNWSLEHALRQARDDHPEEQPKSGSVTVEELLAREAQQLASAARNAAELETPTRQPSQPTQQHDG